MKILLTGAGGFLGQALSRHWGAKHELHSINGREEFLNLGEAPDCDWLVHCGFEVVFRVDPAVECRNRASSEAVARFVKSGKARALLFVSAAGVMGVNDNPEPLAEERLGISVSAFESYTNTAYIQSKLEAETIFRRSEIPLTVVYPTTVFGAGMPAQTLQALLHGRICPPGGTSFLSLSDFLSAMDLLLEGPAMGEGYILNGENISYRDLFRCVREAAGLKNSFFSLPKSLKKLVSLGKILPGASFLSPAILESSFGYKYYSAQKFEQQFQWAATESCHSAILNALGNDNAR